MRLIPLTRGQFAMVDDHDYPRLALYGWQAHFTERGNTFYAYIRIATKFQNAANKRLRSDNGSGYKGVYYHRANDRWVAQITANGKQIYLGIFDNPDTAHAVYCEAARVHHAEFACIP